MEDIISFDPSEIDAALSGAIDDSKKQEVGADADAGAAAGAEGEGASAAGEEGAGADAATGASAGANAAEQGAGEGADGGEDDKDTVIAKLREQLDAATAAGAKKEDTEVEEPQPPELADIEFLPQGVESLDELTRTDANQLLNRVMKEGVKHGFQSALKAIPSIVRHNVMQQIGIQMAVQEFYGSNEDLVPYKKVVGQKAQEVASEHTDWTLDKVFEEAGMRARTQLALQKKALDQQSKGKEKGGFNPPPRGGKQRNAPSKPALSVIEKEIDEMNAAL